VRPGTQLIALVSHDVWVAANFKETGLRGMHAGEPVSVVADAFPGLVFQGEVESLSPASGAQFALLPPENATGNFTRIVGRIPIRITLTSGQDRHDELRPGMSVRVRRDGGN
jgi:membrane fusion protein (multidrug efflux system)